MRVAGLAWMLSPVAAGLGVVVAAAGCAREPVEALCPEVARGELVVTELRGTQSPSDTAGPWIEVYNASGRAIDLMGIELRLIEGDSLLNSTALVRRSLPAEPGSYTVLGLFGDAELPPHVDYGFFLVAAGTPAPAWQDDGALRVTACGAEIDLVRRFTLPEQGSYSLGGVPDANRNDIAASWCTDATQVGASFPGTPGNPNLGCP